MLSTSILYCNKLDDRQLQQLETIVVEGGGGSAEAAAGGGRSSSNNSALGHPNHVQQRPPHSTSNPTSPKVIAHHQHHHQQQLRRRNLAPSTARTNPPSDVFSDVASASASAIITSPTSPTPTSSATSSAVNKNRFRVRYLGCNSCDPRRHRLDGGIASYQKPLLDLYATVLRRSVVLRSLYAYSIAAVNQVADISAHGIVVAERDRFATASSTSPSVRPCSETNGIIANRNHHHRHLQPQPQPRRPNSSVSETVPHSTSQDVSFTAHSSAATVETVVTKVITPLSNILLFAAVRFQHRSRSSAKKSAGNRRGGRRQVVGVAFVPLSCSEAVLDKNAFVSLPAKQRFLLGKLANLKLSFHFSSSSKLSNQKKDFFKLKKLKTA